MPDLSLPKSCKLIRAADQQEGKQGLHYFQGVSADTAGSRHLCMHLITVPPGGRAKVHKHENHETSIYILSGEAYTLVGDRLEDVIKSVAGDMLYIPPELPHLPINLGIEPVVGIVARTDPNEQESLILLPELEEAADEAIERLKRCIQQLRQ
jgi:uncharacterized RmlC-like cupin family protein